VGVRQGDALSVTLFNLVLGNIIRKLDVRWNVHTKTAYINACADDVIIISGNLKALEEALHELDNTAQEIGVIINWDKIKIHKIK
jgi:fido (protein-threonine AMPylation protein)